ncbi:hypothetical protein DPMN_148254 [Dreissena polymorpha]|uniref:Uncharacterized protein n=1 Tax=Dreissena polymorpha TaxID=45954 RepID=A0A9D4FBD9_DREPO|nr:hypothetical protein DPMN_148254 [Dreissena polymorpha]
MIDIPPVNNLYCSSKVNMIDIPPVTNLYCSRLTKRRPAPLYIKVENVLTD